MLEENEGVQREGKDCAWKNKDNGWPLASLNFYLQHSWLIDF